MRLKYNRRWVSVWSEDMGKTPIEEYWKTARYVYETDVMLLGDVFASFRDTSKKKYMLDPAHFMAASSVNGSACL